MNSDRPHETPNQAQSQTPDQPSSRTPRQALAALAGLGIGAAFMYFLDPQGGAKRRALVRDRAGRALRTGKREARDVAEDARNRAAGAAAELRGRMADERITDDQLVERVRAELGHHVERARAIEVVAENGAVTLRGEVPPEKLEEVLSTVRGVRGVESVDSQLRVPGTSGTTPTP